MKFGQSTLYTLRVQFEDLDVGGVVHHPTYLKFCERARSDALRQAGYSFQEVLKEGSAAAVAELWATYVKPARYEQELTVVSRVLAARKSSFKIAQTIVLGTPSPQDILAAGDRLEALGNRVFSAQMRLVMIDLATMRPQPISARMRQTMLLPNDSVLSSSEQDSDVRLNR